jgi:hypothetical protein
MNVYVETGERKMKRKNMLIGGAVAGIIAVVCERQRANTLKRSEKRK